MTTALAIVGGVAIVVFVAILAGAIWALWKFQGRGRW